VPGEVTAASGSILAAFSRIHAVTPGAVRFEDTIAILGEERNTMRKITSAVVLSAGLFAGLATVSAQTPAPPPTSLSTPAASQAPAGQPTTPASLSIVGCLKDEKDVPGLKPSVVERAGITEDYILVEVKAAPGSAVSGLALGTMYEIEGIAEAELKKHLGHQVEISGRIDTTDGGDRDRKDVPDFNATSLKMLAATCPAK
jgi:hypothetical protein